MQPILLPTHLIYQRALQINVPWLLILLLDLPSGFFANFSSLNSLKARGLFLMTMPLIPQQLGCIFPWRLWPLSCWSTFITALLLRQSFVQESLWKYPVFPTTILDCKQDILQMSSVDVLLDTTFLTTDWIQFSSQQLVCPGSLSGQICSKKGFPWLPFRECHFCSVLCLFLMNSQWHQT